MNFRHTFVGPGRALMLEEAPQAREAVQLAPQPRPRPLNGMEAAYQARVARDEETVRQLDRMLGAPVRYGPCRFIDRAMSQCAYILASGLCCGERTARGSWCQKHYDATHVRRAG